MLQKIRDRAQGWFAGVIVFIIIVPFAMWGIQDYLGGGTDPEVAHIGGYAGGTVGGTKITLRRFQQAYEGQRQRLRELLGKNADLLDAEKLKQDVLDSMVGTELLQQSAHDLGLRISDEQLAQHIQAMPEFEDQGQFSKELFTRKVRDAAAFEILLRQDLLSQQLNAAIGSTAIVTPHELNQAIRLKGQQREIGYLILPWKNFQKEVVIKDESVKQYYEQHRDQFINPEQVSIEYLELSSADLAASVTAPSDAELKALYEEQQANFSVEEQRRASHILIKTDENTDKTAAKAKAEELLKRARAGEAFDKLAKEYSQDTGSAAQGGDLGFFGRGAMVKPFEDSVFALKQGEISDLVQSSFGFHIIKLTEIKSARVKPFEEVRAGLDQEYRKREADKQYFDRAERLRDLAYEHPDSLTTAASELGLTIKTSALFGRKGGDGMAAEPKVVSAAFGDDVLVRGNNSDPIEVGENHALVLRVKEHKPSSQRSLADEKQPITEQLTKQAALEKASAVGQAIQARIGKGEEPVMLAQGEQVEWVNTGWVARDDTKLDQPVILSTAFKLNKPDENPALKLPSVGGTALTSGDYAVVALFAVRNGAADTLSGAERTGLGRQLQKDKAAAEFQAYVEGLKKSGKIVLHRDKL